MEIEVINMVIIRMILIIEVMQILVIFMEILVIMSIMEIMETELMVHGDNPNNNRNNYATEEVFNTAINRIYGRIDEMKKY